MTTDAMNRMIKARVGLYTREPFFGTLALKLDLVEDPKCKTSWTDGRSLGFNPEQALVAPLDELEAIVAHHVLTCALGHPFRRGGRDKKLWNKASDIVVNNEIGKAGFHLPEGSESDPRFEGLFTEAIYSELDREQPQQDPQNQPGQRDEGMGGSGQGSGAPGSSESDDQQGQEGDDPEGEPEKQDGDSDAPTGEVRDAPAKEDPEQPASPAEVADMESDWQTAVAQAAQLSKGAGKLAGGIERAIKDVLDPKVDWREALQRYMMARSKDDYSFSKMNRRFIHQRMYLPGMDAPKTGALAAAVDYSGSTTQKDIEQFASEIEYARSILNPEKVIVMIFEDEVVAVLEFGPGESIELPPIKAGGGTKFDGPVRMLAEMDVIPEVLVYLTDLDSTVFADEPEYPVVWVTTRMTTAPYGEVIEMH